MGPVSVASVGLDLNMDHLTHSADCPRTRTFLSHNLTMTKNHCIIRDFASSFGEYIVVG